MIDEKKKKKNVFITTILDPVCFLLFLIPNSHLINKGEGRNWPIPQSSNSIEQELEHGKRKRESWKDSHYEFGWVHNIERGSQEQAEQNDRFQTWEIHFC